MRPREIQTLDSKARDSIQFTSLHWTFYCNLALLLDFNLLHRFLLAAKFVDWKLQSETRRPARNSDLEPVPELAFSDLTVSGLSIDFFIRFLASPLVSRSMIREQRANDFSID